MKGLGWGPHKSVGLKQNHPFAACLPWRLSLEAARPGTYTRPDDRLAPVNNLAPALVHGLWA